MKFIETIKFIDGEPQLLDLHENRFNKTRHFHFRKPPISLKHEVWKVARGADAGVVKCRVVYDHRIQSIQISPYTRRMINSLALVDGTGMNYQWKYEDRTALNQLLQLNREADDILICIDGRLTDTSFTNIALYKSEAWFTPLRPLLQGVRRQKLLNEGVIQEREILADDLGQYSKIRLINALIDWEEEVDIPVSKVVVSG